MVSDSQISSHKKRTNLSIDSQLLFEAKLLSINVSQAAEAGTFGVRYRKPSGSDTQTFGVKPSGSDTEQQARLVRVCFFWNL